MVTLLHMLASLLLSLPALPLVHTVHTAQVDGQDERERVVRLLHDPEPGSGQIYEVLTSYRNEADETDLWDDGKRTGGRGRLTGVAIEQTLRLYDHFPGGQVLVRREILDLEHEIAITIIDDSKEQVSRARGEFVDTGREFELRRVAGATSAWRLLPRRDPLDDLRRVTMVQMVDQFPLKRVLAAFPRTPLLSGLLPAHPVAVGERWELTTASALAALLPAGELPVTFVDVTDQRPPFGYGWYVSPAVAMQGDAAGECFAELLRLEEKGGRQLAVIGLEVSVEVVADLLGHFEAEGSKFLRAGSEWGFEGKGELLWDVSASRVVELTLRGRVLQLWDFRFDKRWESRQISRGRLDVRVREALR